MIVLGGILCADFTASCLSCMYYFFVLNDSVDHSEVIVEGAV